MKFSDVARPPVQPQEAEKADTAICPTHGGIIRWNYCKADIDRVFYCPIGRQMWRFATKRTGMYAPLDYKHPRPV